MIKNNKEINEIKSLDEAVIYLSHINNDKNKLTQIEIDLAIKTHGQNGTRALYFIYSKMITDKFDDAYVLLSPLLIMSSKRDELIKKIENIMSISKRLNIEITYEEKEVHQQTLFIAFYLLKNHILPDLKPLNFGGV